MQMYPKYGDSFDNFKVKLMREREREKRRVNLHSSDSHQFLRYPTVVAEELARLRTGFQADTALVTLELSCVCHVVHHSVIAWDCHRYTASDRFVRRTIRPLQSVAIAWPPFARTRINRETVSIDATTVVEIFVSTLTISTYCCMLLFRVVIRPVFPDLS